MSCGAQLVTEAGCDPPQVRPSDHRTARHQRRAGAAKAATLHALGAGRWAMPGRACGARRGEASLHMRTQGCMNEVLPRTTPTCATPSRSDSVSTAFWQSAKRGWDTSTLHSAGRRRRLGRLLHASTTNLSTCNAAAWLALRARLPLRLGTPPGPPKALQPALTRRGAPHNLALVVHKGANRKLLVPAANQKGRWDMQ